MEIIWHGHSCFTIKTKEGIVVINPYQPEIGLKLPNLKANVVLISAENDPAYNNAAAVAGDPKVLTWPGEYEVAEIAITAQEVITPDSKAKSMLFTLDADGLKVCYISGFDGSFTDEVVESIGQVDVLIVPVGEGKSQYKAAHEAIEEIEPRAVIPMRYASEGLKIELEPLESFAKQAGLATIEAKDKFSLTTKSELSEEKTTFIILNAQIA